MMRYMRFTNILQNIIRKSNSKNGLSKIPFNQQYETKDFVLKDNNNKIGIFKYKENIFPSSKIPYKEQYETKDF
jgi:hypothetical protein